MQTTRDRQDVVPPGTPGIEPPPSRANPWLIGAVVVLSIALIAALTWGFSEGSTIETPAVASDAMVIEAVYTSINGFTNGNADVVRQVYAPDAVFYDLISGTTYTGVDEIAGAAVDITKSFGPGWLQLTTRIVAHDGTAAYGFQFDTPENNGITFIEVNADGQITYEVVRNVAAKPLPVNG